MHTSFALISSFQVRENYAVHNWDGVGCPTQWKCKGTEEVVVAENLSVAEVINLGDAGLRDLVEQNLPVSDIYYEYSGMDYELVELNQHTIDIVKEYINSDRMFAMDYYIYVDISMDLGISEYAAKWALQALGEMEYF